MKPLYWGLDIGGTKCALVTGTEDCQVLSRCAVATADFASWQSLLEALLAQAPQEAPAAIGVSCGGPLDSRNGRILSPPNLPGWDDVPIVEWLKSRVGAPAFLQNDANACALAEWRFGAGKGCENMVFLTFGTGFGAGLILDGRLYSGTNDMAGEVGHVRAAADGPVGYGKAGSYEGFCSGGGIRQLAGGVSAKEAVARAEAGDAQMQAVLEKSAQRLGACLAMLIDLLNPQKIVIGSIYARAEKWFRETALRVIEEEALVYPRQRVLHRAGGLGRRDWRCCGAQRCDSWTGDGSVKDVHANFEKAVELLLDCFRSGHKLLLCGNGGSAADCAHILGELVKGFCQKRPLRAELASSIGEDWAKDLQQGLPVIDLTANCAVISAIVNDIDGASMFAQQVIAYAAPGDVLIAISTSGNAENVRRAAVVARAKGAKVIGMTGQTGGALVRHCDLLLNVPQTQTYLVQEQHLPLYHALCLRVEDALFAQ